MNTTAKNLPAERRPQLVAGAPVAALVPQSLEEAFRLSQALAASGMAPRGIDKPEQILVAVMAGAELGLAPFQSLQSFAVVNGRPTLWGDGLMAVVRAKGVKVKEWIDGDGENMVAHCIATRPDTGEEIARKFTVAQAKKAGLWGKTGPWQAYPERMMQMRARALALRDGCADMLRGIQVREEVEDYGTVRPVSGPAPSGLAARLNGPTTDEGFNANHAPAEPVDFVENAEEVAEAEFEPAQVDTPTEAETPPSEPSEAAAQVSDDTFPADRQDDVAADIAGADFDALDWAASFTRGLQQLHTVAEVQDAWKKAKADGKVLKLQGKSRELAEELVKAVNERAAELRTDDQ